MTTNAKSAFGTTFTWNGTTLAELRNVSGPSLKVDTIDVTSHASTSAFREFLAGLADAGEVTMELSFYPGDTNGQKALIDDAIARTSRAFIVTGPTAAAYTWSGTGIITSVEPGQPHDGALTLSITMKITGVPTFSVTATANLTTLTGIEENAGAALTFAPVFAGGTYAYMITVNAASTWIKVTPTLVGSTTTITQDSDSNSQTVASGAQSGTIALNDGAVTIVTLSVQTSGAVPKIYKLYVYNA